MSSGILTTRTKRILPFRTERRDFWRYVRPPKIRSISDFAEQELTLPDTGPHAGRKFRRSFQPFTGLYLDAIDSGLFNLFAATGPSQSGKTYLCCVIPTMYHLFEIKETVIFFAPSMEINEDKWLVDIRPSIEKSRFADFLPRTGKGSQGGFSELITFRNGVRLKWMTGGGGDKNKAAFTARVAIGTEVNGMDTASETSRETDPLGQIKARLLSHGSRAVRYHECTVDTPEGRIWQDVTNGSNSRIVLECPHCFRWVTPDRADFLGWDSAETELQSEQRGRFFCPECGTAWSADQRKSANARCRLVHSGQHIDQSGNIVGEMPETRTFGFRWSAVNNMFAEESQIGREEWAAARNVDRESVEKERCQFIWCIPYSGEPTGLELTEEIVASRLTGIPRGILPDDTETLVVQIDLHMRWHYWEIVATGPNDVRSIIDYGVFPTPNPEINGEEEAVRLGLEQLAKEIESRRFKTVSGSDREIDLKLCDAGYQQDIALEFITGRRGWRLLKGQGKEFKQQKERTSDCRPGNHWYDSRQLPSTVIGNRRWWLLVSETSYWMRQVHNGFVATTFLEDGTRRPGSIALFGSDPKVHSTPVDRLISRSAFATQLLAWKWGSTHTPKGGEVMDWISQWKEDHWFDTSYGCLVGDLIVRSARQRSPDQQQAPQAPKASTTTASEGRFRFLGNGERPRLS